MGSFTIKLAYMVVVCMALLAVGAPMAKAKTCDQVREALKPCMNYLRWGGRRPTPACCTGVRNVVDWVQTTPDRRTVCKCLKNAFGGNQGLNPKFAESLPSQCKVNIPYKTIKCA